ncbi:MAG: GlsB/YeaQ/YmgE family stress response membrane protein [Ignavibacteria bacterium]
MTIIWTIVIGLIAGALAKFIMPGKDPGGIIITILIGIAGSVVFTYLGKFIGIYEVGEAAGFIGATIGAIILLAIYRFIKKQTV